MTSAAIRSLRNLIGCPQLRFFSLAFFRIAEPLRFYACPNTREQAEQYERINNTPLPKEDSKGAYLNNDPQEDAVRWYVCRGSSAIPHFAGKLAAYASSIVTVL
jgi:hypothetical protein